jgi:UDP-glucose 4-epimerase
MIEVFSPTEKKSRIIEVPTGNSFTSFVMDIQNARDELGYEPEYNYMAYLQDYKKEQQLKRFDALWEESSVIAPATN